MRIAWNLIKNGGDGQPAFSVSIVTDHYNTPKYCSDPSVKTFFINLISQHPHNDLLALFPRKGRESRVLKIPSYQQKLRRPCYKVMSTETFFHAITGLMVDCVRALAHSSFFHFLLQSRHIVFTLML